MIVPTFNRPVALRASLAAITNVTPPPGDFEVIVIDDGGTADLSFVDDFPGARLHRQTNSGPATARNAGIWLARGSRIAMTDDDCRPAKDWLVELDKAVDEDPEALVGGATRNGLANSPFSAATQDVANFLTVSHRRPQFIPSNNVAGRADLLREIGGFDKNYPLAAGEDRAFCHAWLTSGRAIRYFPSAVVHHYHPFTARSFWRRHVEYGRGAFRFRCISVGSGSGWRLSSFSFYLRLIVQPFYSEQQPGRLQRSALLMVAQFATAAGFVSEMMRTRDSSQRASRMPQSRPQGPLRSEEFPGPRRKPEAV